MHGAYTRTLKLMFRQLRKGSKNHAENELENTPKNDRIWQPFRHHFGFLFLSEKPSKINQKIKPFWKRFWHRFWHHFGNQNPFKNASKNNTDFHRFFRWFWVSFGTSFLRPRPPKWNQENQTKKSDEKGKARPLPGRRNTRPGRAGGVSPPIRGRLLWKLPLSVGGISWMYFSFFSVGFTWIELMG